MKGILLLLSKMLTFLMIIILIRLYPIQKQSPGGVEGVLQNFAKFNGKHQ